jgi:membrane protein required for colicin V production
MGLIDWIIVAATALSMLIGLIRGFVREILSVVGWVVGLAAAFQYAVPLGQWLPLEAAMPGARTGLAAVAIVLAAVLVAGLIGWLLRQFVSAVRLSAGDRALGTVFGLARALLIVFAAELFFGRTTMAQQPLWRESILLDYAEAAVRLAAPMLPDGLRRQAAG